jgi:hypothetical protein
VLEPGQHARGGEQLDPGGGKLEGERQPVEAGADLGDGLGVLVRDDEVRVDAQGALREQGHRFEVREPVAGGEPFGVRHPEREHGELLLPGQAKGRPARDQHRQPGGRPQQLGDDGAGVEDLLEVVEHEEQLAVTQRVHERRQDLPVGFGPEPERHGDGRRHQARIADGREVHEEHAVGWDEATRGLDGQPGLPAASRAGQGEQPRGAQESPDPLQLPVSAHEARKGNRQVGRDLQGPRCRELGRERVDHDLVQVLGLGQVLEAVPSERPQAHAGGQRVLDQAPGRGGDQDLPAVARRGDPGGPVDVDSDVVVPAQDTFTRVESHANAEGVQLGGRGDAPLGRDGSGDRGRGASKDGEDRVPLGPEVHAVGLADHGPHQPVVPLDDLGPFRPELADQPRGALDVREQEGHGPGRTPGVLGHPRAPVRCVVAPGAIGAFSAGAILTSVRHQERPATRSAIAAALPSADNERRGRRRCNELCSVGRPSLPSSRGCSTPSPMGRAR